MNDSTRRRRVFPAVALALVSAIFVCGCERAPGSVSDGDKAPDFVLPRLDGSVQKLANYRGSVVLVNFWATWCPPCIEEIPVLDRIAKEYGSQGLVVLALAGDDEIDRVQDFVDRQPLGFEVLHDPGGATGTVYGITGYPETFIIDRDGIVIAKMIGPLPAAAGRPSSDLVAMLDAAIRQGA